MTSKLKKIIIMITLIGILFIVYVLFFKKSGNSEVLISGTNSLNRQKTIAETQILGNQITEALLQIESLNLERTIFDSKILTSLVDRSEPISPEPIGRKNPFAPLSDTSVNYNSGVAPYSEDENLGTSSTTKNNNLPIFSSSTSTKNGTSTITNSSSSPILGL